MGRKKKTLTIISVGAMMFASALVTSAQWNSRNRNTGGVYSNRGYYNLDTTVKSLSDKSKSFASNLDHELDRSVYNGTDREDYLNHMAKDFKKAADNLKNEYRDTRDLNRSRDEAQNVLSLGSQMSRALANSQAYRNSTLQNSWRDVEGELNIISQAYGIRYDSRGSYNTRNGNVYGNGNGNRNGNVYGRGNGNRNGNRNGTYGTYNPNLRSTIVNLKNGGNRFENRIDDEKRNVRSGSYNEIEKLSDKFADATKKLEKSYDKNNDYDRSYDHAREVIYIGEQLDREISRSGVSRNIRSDWSRIRRDLNELARAYNIRFNGSNSTSGTFGDIIRNLPF